MIEVRKVDQLAPFENNPRRHSAEQIAQLAVSIETFGFVNPVLVDTAGGIVAGHGRVIAARTLYEQGASIRGPGGDPLPAGSVPCLVLHQLTPAQRRAYVIADNRLAETGGGWDEDLLRLMMLDLQAAAEVDLVVTGFSEADVDALLNGWRTNLDASPSPAPAASAEGAAPARIVVLCPAAARSALVVRITEALAAADLGEARVE